MRRAVVYAATITALLVGGAMGPPGSSASIRPAHPGAEEQVNANQRWRWDDCRFRNLHGEPGAFGRLEMELIVRCGNRHWPVPGGVPKAFAVISCESGWGQFAVSPGGHLGLMQFHPDTFASVMQRWSGLWDRWGVHAAPLNARSNALAGMRKASADGWSAWSCA
jgi:hypothetical protein